MTLLCYGANPSLPDNCYETVRDLAESQDIRDLLVEAEQRALTILTQLREIELHPSISLEFMIRDQANQIEQLQYNAKLNEKRVTLIANGIERIKLGSNTEACPAEMDGVKEQKVHSPHRWVYSNKQAHYTKNVNREEVRHLARDIKCMKLQPNTHLSRIKELSLISSSIMEKYSAIIESPLGFNSLRSNDRCRGN